MGQVGGRARLLVFIPKCISSELNQKQRSQDSNWCLRGMPASECAVSPSWVQIPQSVLGFPLVAVPSMGLERCLMVLVLAIICTCHTHKDVYYGVIQASFTALSILCSPLHHLPCSLATTNLPLFCLFQNVGMYILEPSNVWPFWKSSFI